MADKYTELILHDKEKLTKLLNTKDVLLQGKIFGQRIFLIETIVAGTTHLKDDLKVLEAELRAGDRLSFYREPDNPHDNNAISVRNSEGKKIGYVPMTKNEILARLMDGGKLIYGTVRDKELVNSWLKITMEIFLDD
jgi:hypothetical protein